MCFREYPDILTEPKNNEKLLIFIDRASRYLQTVKDRLNNDILFHFRKDGLPMTKLSQLKIDPEFQNQINPPSFEETHQLEMNILKEERVLNPIITWNGYIVDGQNDLQARHSGA